MRPNVPRGTTASEVLPSTNSKIAGVRSFADNLNKEQGIVSYRRQNAFAFQ